MEEKRRDSAGTPPTPTIETPAPALEPVTSSRRRGGGQKRKLTSINSSGGGGSSGGLDPQATSSKRQSRDKTPVTPLPPIHLNGPCTRARVQPNGSNGLSESATAGGKMDADSRDGVKGKDFGGMCDNLEAFEEQIEAEYEAIMSRDRNVHVVPVHAGWFSWTKIHPLEERMLHSFFDGKSDNRTPEIYMEIRNWIMKKFHQNPNSQIELEQLSELTVGDSDARQEVVEFLDYWGVINYHPFPHNEPSTVTVVDDDYDDEEASKEDTLLEKLFQFETVQSMTLMVTRTDTEMPAMPSGLLPESVITEELFKSEGPDVGYHCNSCSTDCSRKRYHCQKQADFDLCAECFSNGKFGSDMSPSDFILMEPAEASGVNGGKWTDQETLLLLEAIELFRDNWSEIAEHVATKTKAQCILHFVQMPIEDAFYYSDDENVVPKESIFPVSLATEKPSPKSDQDRDTSIKVVTEKTDSPVRVSDDQATSCQVVISIPEQVNNTCKNLEATENFAQKSLKEAFEAVGSLFSPGEKLSFAEAGNPVMALASFLVRLVEPNIAAGSVQSFFKSLSSNCSSEELSARHCFRLEDPSDDKKNLSQSDGTATGSIEIETRKDENEHVGKQNEGTPESVDGIRNANNENKDSASGELKAKVPALDLKLIASTSNECVEKSGSRNDSVGMVTNEVARTASSRKSRPRKRALKDAEASVVSASHTEIHPSYPKEPEDGSLAVEPCQSQDPLKDDTTSHSEKKESEVIMTSNPITEKEESTGDKEAKECDQGKIPLVTKNDIDINKLKRVAATALSAAAVKAKLLADQEEDQIRQLAISLVEKQLYKLETKLAFFSDLENVVIRVKEQLDRSKQRLFQERAQIIAARLGMQGSARPTSQQLPPNRAAHANFPNQTSRPIMGINALRPPISRPPMAPNFAPNMIMPGRGAGSSMHPHFDKFSSYGTR